MSSFTDRSVGIEASLDLAEMSVQYNDVVIKMLEDLREDHSIERELLRVRYETGKFKRAVQRKFASHSTSGLYVSEFQSPVHLADGLKRLQTKLFTHAAPFQHFNVLLMQSYVVKSRRLSTRVQENVQDMGNGCVKCEELKRE